jgi:hypothetical protein
MLNVVVQPNALGGLFDAMSDDPKVLRSHEH